MQSDVAFPAPPITITAEDPSIVSALAPARLSVECSLSLGGFTGALPFLGNPL
jgi:hypothetical protein